MPYTRTDEDENWINEAASISERRARAQTVARTHGRVSVETPPYKIGPSVPDWAARWGESAPPVGTVLRWTPVDGSVSHLAISVGDDEWRVTMSTGGAGALSFSELARMIANSPCDVGVDWREIPTVAARPAGDDAVKSWASQFLAEREVAKVNSDAGTPVGPTTSTPTEGH